MCMRIEINSALLISYLRMRVRTLCGIPAPSFASLCMNDVKTVRISDRFGNPAPRTLLSIGGVCAAMLSTFSGT